MTRRATRIDKKLATALLVCAIALAAMAPDALAHVRRGPCLPARPHGPSCLIWTAKVTFVDDGDTVDVKIDGGRKRRVRFTGINAPELTRYSSKASKRASDGSRSFIGRALPGYSRSVRSFRNRWQMPATARIVSRAAPPASRIE